MRTLISALLLVITSVVSAEDDLRSGTPKDCYLFSYGKGPNWIAKVSTEFRLSLLNLKMPYVDDQFSEPTEKALAWIERQKEPTITTLASVEGRKVIQVVYPENGPHGKTIGTILLAIETARKKRGRSFILTHKKGSIRILTCLLGTQKTRLME